MVKLLNIVSYNSFEIDVGQRLKKVKKILKTSMITSIWRVMSMKLGIALEDENGLYSNICGHFRKSSHFFPFGIDKNKVINSGIVPNYVQYNGKEDKVADEISKYRITHLITDNMRVTAQKRFAQASVQVFRYLGNVKDAIDNFQKNVELAKKLYLLIHNCPPVFLIKFLLL